MSFSSSFSIPIENTGIPTTEQFPMIITLIQQKLSVIKSSLSTIQKMPKEKRIEIHQNLKSSNELAKKMQIGLSKLNSPNTKALYQKWNKKLEQELTEITNYARQLIKTEEFLQENKEFSEEDALISPQQQIIEFELEMQSDIIKEREEKIYKITEKIFTVNSMLRDLSEMVYEQGGMIDNIESNIEDSAIKSKKAVNELTKSEKDSKSGKQRQCLIILLVVLLLFVISVVGTSYYHHSINE